MLSPKQKTHTIQESELGEEYQLQKFQAIRYSQTDTIRPTPDKKGYRDLDFRFLEDVKRIADTNRGLLRILRSSSVMLSDKECDEIDYKASLHRQANIINSNSKFEYEKTDSNYRCNCGCKRARGAKIPICCKAEQLRCLGSSVVLFQLFQKGALLILVLATLIFGIFATYLNLSRGGQPANEHNCTSQSCAFMVNSSAENRSDGQLANLEFMLGIAFCVTWIFSLRVLKYKGAKIDHELDTQLKTSADYSVKVDNLPFGDYNEEQIIQYFEKLQADEGEEGEKQEIQRPLQMKSIQVIYNLQFCRNITSKIKRDCSAISKLLIQRENGLQVSEADVNTYRQYKLRIIQAYEVLSDLRKKFLTDPSFRKKIATATCLIEFHGESGQQALLQRFGKEKIGLIKQIQAIVTGFFCPSSKNILFHGRVLQIERAPQPSDIIWRNCEKKKSISRLVLIYLVTFLMILVSFALLLGLKYMNLYLTAQNSDQASNLAQIISLGTTIALQIVNKLLWVVLHLLLDLEYNNTLTNKIVSLMNKALFATCINILILPVIVYAELQNNLFGPNGLVGFVYNYHITVITAGLALKLFNPLETVIRLALSIRFLRNKILRFLRHQYGQEEEQAFCKRINKLYEGQKFNVAESYIFVITNVFHAVFFCHLAPSLLLFAALEVAIYFWVARFKILRLFKIPELTEIMVYNTAISQIGVVPIIYGCGSHLIGYFEHNRFETYTLRAALEFAAIGMGVLTFLNPGDLLNILTRCVMHFIETGNKVKETKEDPSLSNSQMVKQVQGPQNARLENYYDSSNSLHLLGFERILTDNSLRQFGNQLRFFCEQFFTRRGGELQEEVVESAGCEQKAGYQENTQHSIM